MHLHVGAALTSTTAHDTKRLQFLKDFECRLMLRVDCQKLFKMATSFRKVAGLHALRAQAKAVVHRAHLERGSGRAEVRHAQREGEAERMDEGHQAPGFFMRPSTRTRKQVVQAQQMQQAALPKLLEVDPNGVARALESFHSVGLQLFKRPKRFRRADALQERFCTMIAIFLALVVVLWLNQHGKDLVMESKKRKIGNPEDVAQAQSMLSASHASFGNPMFDDVGGKLAAVASASSNVFSSVATGQDNIFRQQLEAAKIKNEEEKAAMPTKVFDREIAAGRLLERASQTRDKM